MCDCKAELILHFVEKEIKKNIKASIESKQHISFYNNSQDYNNIINTMKKKSVEELEETLLNQI
jgi:hypothetical protein